MRGDDEKRLIVSIMMEKIQSMPRVTAATAPIFCVDRSRNPKFFASAVLLKVKNYHFALTAGHVLDKRSVADMYIGSGDKVVLLEGSCGCTVPPGTGNRKQGRIDIGIVRLSEKAVGDMVEDEFLTLDNIYNTDTATTGGHYVFVGYPTSKHKKAIRRGQAEATPYLFVVDPAPLVDYHNEGLNPGISLLLRFDRQNLWRPSGRVVGPDPTGVSGGGVWFLNNAFAITALNPLLVAIAIEKWEPPKPKRILATKLHVALSAIWDHFPELRS